MRGRREPRLLRRGSRNGRREPRSGPGRGRHRRGEHLARRRLIGPRPGRPDAAPLGPTGLENRPFGSCARPTRHRRCRHDRDARLLPGAPLRGDVPRGDAVPPQGAARPQAPLSGGVRSAGADRPREAAGRRPRREPRVLFGGPRPAGMTTPDGVAIRPEAEAAAREARGSDRGSDRGQLLGIRSRRAEDAGVPGDGPGGPCDCVSRVPSLGESRSGKGRSRLGRFASKERSACSFELDRLDHLPSETIWTYPRGSRIVRTAPSTPAARTDAPFRGGRDDRTPRRRMSKAHRKTPRRIV